MWGPISENLTCPLHSFCPCHYSGRPLHPPRCYNSPATGFTAFTALWFIYLRVCSSIRYLTSSPKNMQWLSFVHWIESRLRYRSFKVLPNLDLMIFFPVISLSPSSLAFTYSSSSFSLHILQFIGFMPSLCLGNSPSPTLISIYLNLAHLYQLKLVRKSRDQK